MMHRLLTRLANTPRSWLTIAVVLAGIVGIVFGQQFRWTAIESFIYTLLLAVGFILLTVGIYNNRRQNK